MLHGVTSFQLDATPTCDLAPVGVGHPDGAEHRPGPGALHAVGDLEAVRLHVLRHRVRPARAPSTIRLRLLVACSRPSVPSGHERSRRDFRRLPHLHVIREAPHRARRALGRRLRARARRHVGRASSTTREVWQHAADGTWTPLAKADVDLSSLRRRTAVSCSSAPTTRGCSASTAGGSRRSPSFESHARPRRVAHGRTRPQRALDDEHVRRRGACSPTSTSAGSRAPPTSARPWEPTIDVDDDVHQVRRASHRRRTS